MKKASIGIIGMGWVGSSVAISILHQGICKELLLNDAKEGLAEGEAMDLMHGSSFFPTAAIHATSIDAMLNCHAIVVTAGRGGRPGETRLELLKDNIGIAKSISQQLQGYKGILIVVSNPVDVLTYFYQKFSGIPASRVIGTGTMLDTARLRAIIGEKLDLNPRVIQADVIGEHGDSEVILWSKATIGSDPLSKWTGWKSEDKEAIAEQVRAAAQQIIKRKGATNHAIGLVTATLLKWILRGERRIITLSTRLSGTFGLFDVAISLPCLISENGIKRILEIDMSEEEQAAFLRSCEVIRKAIEEIENG